jgi:hypothetical protein
MQRWEHMCATWVTHKDDWMHQSEEITKMQKDGWELASLAILQIEGVKLPRTILWFKRPHQGGR